MCNEVNKEAVNELLKLQGILKERIDDYKIAIRASGHPAIYNRQAEVKDILCIVNERLNELQQ